MIIWKFDLAIQESNTITMPEGAEIVHVGVQYGTLRIWVKCDPLKPDTNRVFRIFATGHEFDERDLIHIGSVFTEGGLYVWHIFEVARFKK